MTLNMMLDNAAPEAIAGALIQQHPGLFFTMVEQASVAISPHRCQRQDHLRQPSVLPPDRLFAGAIVKPEPAPAGQQPDAARDSIRRCGIPCSSVSPGAVS